MQQYVWLPDGSAGFLEDVECKEEEGEVVLVVKVNGSLHNIPIEVDPDTYRNIKTNKNALLKLAQRTLRTMNPEYPR